MHSFQINSNKSYFIVGMVLLLMVVAFSSFMMYGQAQAAPGDAQSIESANIKSGYCSASRSLAHRAILRRLRQLDFALSDGRGNALGLRDEKPKENVTQTINLQRLDFAWSDGRGNALGLRDENISLANNVLAAICLNHGN